MNIIIALGNPGEKYKLTRHNAGFLALDFILDGPDLAVFNEFEKFDAIIKEVKPAGSGMPGETEQSTFEKTLAVYPQTFMNNSGIAIRAIMDFYKCSPKDIFVLHDEIDLPLGVFRFTDNSSPAGHNGIKSIIDALGTQEFRRIRIGIDSRESRAEMPTDAFVLQKFTDEQLQKIPFAEIKARTLLGLYRE